MVTMTTLKRPAIAMIELIFAIVVMGIVMMSAPMLISTAASTTTVAHQQEGIHEATSRINMILTYPWDEADTNDSCMPPVLHVSTSADNELAENGITARRIGLPIDTKSRTYLCGTQELNATFPLGSEAGDAGIKDDIDDFRNGSSLVDIVSGTGGKDYLEKTTVSIGTAITYIDGNASYGNSTFSYVPGADVNASTNIKKISVTLTSTSTATELNKKSITLSAFSCNIGGVHRHEYEKRIMP